MKESQNIMDPLEEASDLLQSGTTPLNKPAEEAFRELTESVHAALETYSNVHRGSGHFSLATTRMFERARDLVLDYLGLEKRRYHIIFGTPYRTEMLRKQLDPGCYHMVTSREIGLSLGVCALAVKRGSLSKRLRFHSGGGTARLVSRDKVIWADAPDRFEAGTPAIINIIAFARALQLIRHYRISDFRNPEADPRATAGISSQGDVPGLSGRPLLDEIRKTLIGNGLPVPSHGGRNSFINLDNSASTPSFLPAWTAARLSMRIADPDGRDVVKEAGTVCASFLNAPESDYDLLFTSNTTESINLVAESLRRTKGSVAGPVILNTLLEHNSNDLPWRMIPGGVLLKLSIDDEGIIDLNELEATLKAYNREGLHGDNRIVLVAVTGASNVLGIYNDLEEISRIVHLFGAHLLVDAAQMAAHRRIDMAGWGIDYLAFSGHKVYAPFGCGVLAVRKGLLGFSTAEQEQIRLSGEENICGIAAMGAALRLMQRIGMDRVQQEEQVLTARLLRGISQIPGLKVFGIGDPDSPSFSRKGGVIAFEIKGRFADRIAKELAERAGIGVRYGCHCAHLLIKHLFRFTPLLERIQNGIVTVLPALRLPGMTRVSLGIGNNEEDVDTLIRVLAEIARKEPMPKTRIKKQIEEFASNAEKRVYS